MRRSERQFFLDAINPYLREGETLFEGGTALIYEPVGGSDRLDNRWYLDCPSSLGSTDRREIGRVEQAPGWRAWLVCWTSKSPRFLGKGWEGRMLTEFLRLTGLDQRKPIAWAPKTVEVSCFCCGTVRSVTRLGPAAFE